MSRPRKTNLLWTLWTIALLTTCTLWAISLRRNLCYAGDFGFISVTNGYLILPAGGARTWGDWGWWVQAPWPYPVVTWNEFVFPLLVGPVRQMGATGIYLPFSTCFGLLIIWPMRKIAGRISRSIFLSAMCLAASMVPYMLIGPVYQDDYSRFFFVTWIVLFFNTSLAFCEAVRFRRQQRPGFCAECGYDLTGNQSGVCPECGQSILAFTLERLGRRAEF